MPSKKCAVSSTPSPTSSPTSQHTSNIPNPQKVSNHTPLTKHSRTNDPKSRTHTLQTHIFIYNLNSNNHRYTNNDSTHLYLNLISSPFKIAHFALSVGGWWVTLSLEWAETSYRAGRYVYAERTGDFLNQRSSIKVMKGMNWRFTTREKIVYDYDDWTYDDWVYDDGFTMMDLWRLWTSHLTAFMSTKMRLWMLYDVDVMFYALHDLEGRGL